MDTRTKKIKLQLQYIPEREDAIEVEISQNATVADLEEKVKDALKDFNNVPMGILKFNRQELNDKNKTLADLGMKDGSTIENENRVFIKALRGATIGIICNKNTTLKEFLEKASDSEVLQNDVFIRLTFGGRTLSRKDLESKLFSVQTLLNDGTIGYGSILHIVLFQGQEESNYDTVFDLRNLGSTSEGVKEAYKEYQKSKKNTIDMASYYYYISNQKSGNRQKRKLQNNWPLSRKIIGVIDLILLAAAVTTFLLYFLTTLSLSVAVPIVLAALFVTFAVLFFGWNTILPKILPKGCLEKLDLGTNLNEEYKNEIKGIENNKGNNPKEENKEKEENKDN